MVRAAAPQHNRGAGLSRTRSPGLPGSPPPPVMTTVFPSSETSIYDVIVAPTLFTDYQVRQEHRDLGIYVSSLCKRTLRGCMEEGFVTFSTVVFPTAQPTKRADPKEAAKTDREFIIMRSQNARVKARGRHDDWIQIRRANQDEGRHIHGSGQKRAAETLMRNRTDICSS